MRTLFADTFFWISLLSPSDRTHRRALDFTVQFRGHLVTTAWVITELADGFSDERSRARFVRFFDRLLARGDVAVLPCEQRLFDAGMDLYRRRLDKEWSLTDCISFAVMERAEGIAEALTGDHHFEQAGFKILLA